MACVGGHVCFYFLEASVVYHYLCLVVGGVVGLCGVWVRLGCSPGVGWP